MKAIFLDRDNTLIENTGDLGNPADVTLRAGVGSALRELRKSGHRLIVVTNQGGVARGKYTERDVDAVHQRIAELVDRDAGATGLIDRFYYCPYHPDGTVEEYRREHPWRKPQPGMLVQAARDLGLDLPACWMVGDQVRDIEAGRSAGCRTVLINPDEDVQSAAEPSFSVDSMEEAAQAILSASSNGVVLVDELDQSTVAGRPSSRVQRPPGSTPSADAEQYEPMRRALHELADEMRTDRLRRTDFTPLRMAAGLCQLLVLLFGLLALLQVGTFNSFMQWMAAAVLFQLVTITLALLDLRS